MWSWRWDLNKKELEFEVGLGWLVIILVSGISFVIWCLS